MICSQLFSLSLPEEIIGFAGYLFKPTFSYIYLLVVTCRVAREIPKLTWLTYTTSTSTALRPVNWHVRAGFLSALGNTVTILRTNITLFFDVV